jgi:hypothetical protein
MMQIDDKLIRVIDSLTNAVNVCYEVDNTSDDYEKTYPFATGYSRSAMNTAIEDLSRIVEYLRKDDY